MRAIRVIIYGAAIAVIAIMVATYQGPRAASGATPPGVHHRPQAAPSVPELASWYGPGLIGNGLACPHAGALQSDSRVVASWTRPCGQRLRICWQKRCTIAVVADRGPATWTGRTLDLGPGVARRLGFSGVHVVRVRTLR